MVCARDVGAPLVARRWLVRHLADHVDWSQLQMLTLIVSELVTNAVAHGSGEVGVRVVLDGRMVRLEVTDGARDREPVLVPRASAVDPNYGRGLRLVTGLADQWGWDRLDDAKTVWAEVRLRDQSP